MLLFIECERVRVVIFVEAIILTVCITFIIKRTAFFVYNDDELKLKDYYKTFIFMWFYRINCGIIYWCNLCKLTEFCMILLVDNLICL
jgi:hypothetical protein